MGSRYRSRSRSYSPRRESRSPPRRNRYDDRRSAPDRSFKDRRSAAPSGLLIRNISLGARPEDLRVPFERFGPIRDVYLPKNYHTGEPRGFGFVKFRSAEDAAEAKHHMNHQIIGGREISIVYAEENRKTPQEMRSTGRTSGRYGGGSRRRSPPRSPRGRSQSYSRSPSRHDLRERDRGTRCDYSPPRSVSPSPQSDRECSSQQRSPTPKRSRRSPSRSRSRTYSPR